LFPTARLGKVTFRAFEETMPKRLPQNAPEHIMKLWETGEIFSQPPVHKLADSAADLFVLTAAERAAVDDAVVTMWRSYRARVARTVEQIENPPAAEVNTNPWTANLLGPLRERRVDQPVGTEHPVSDEMLENSSWFYIPATSEVYKEAIDELRDSLDRLGIVGQQRPGLWAAMQWELENQESTGLPVLVWFVKGTFSTVSHERIAFWAQGPTPTAGPIPNLPPDVGWLLGAAFPATGTVKPWSYICERSNDSVRRLGQ
jgi:hypothetical protein